MGLSGGGGLVCFGLLFVSRRLPRPHFTGGLRGRGGSWFWLFWFYGVVSITVRFQDFFHPYHYQYPCPLPPCVMCDPLRCVLYHRVLRGGDGGVFGQRETCTMEWDGMQMQMQMQMHACMACGRKSVRFEGKAWDGG